MRWFWLALGTLVVSGALSNVVVLVALACDRHAGAWILLTIPVAFGIVSKATAA